MHMFINSKIIYNSFITSGLCIGYPMKYFPAIHYYPRKTEIIVRQTPSRFSIFTYPNNLYKMIVHMQIWQIVAGIYGYL